MIGACPPVVLAKAVRPVTTMCRCSAWREAVKGARRGVDVVTVTVLVATMANEISLSALVAARVVDVAGGITSFRPAADEQCGRHCNT